MLLARLKQARLVWPTLLSLAGIVLLTGLGSWQLERRRWKEALIAKIDARVHAPPLALADAEAVLRAGGDIEYLHVVARGRFRNEEERYLYAPSPSGLGWQVYTPLELAPARFVWVNRGFVPDDRKPPAGRAPGLLSGEVAVAGLVRAASRQGSFVPRNDVAGNVWYWPDLAAMSASSALPGKGLAFAIEADARPAPLGGLPQGGVTPLSLPNHHLQYALTWYALALALIAVYLAFAVGRLGQSTPAGPP
jgi:surfeit locus 1 family protein